MSTLSEFLAGRGTVRLSRELLSESLILVSMQDTAEVECFIRVFGGPQHCEICLESFESLILVGFQDTAEVECFI